MPKTDFEKAQGSLGALFDILQIRRVVCVDDEYITSVSPDDIIALCTKAGTPACQQVFELTSAFFDGGPDVWEPRLREHWDELDEQTQRRAYQQLQFQLNTSVEIADVIAMCKKLGTDVCATLPELQEISFAEGADWEADLTTRWDVSESETRNKLYRELQFRDRDDERIDAVAASTLAGLLHGYELLELTPDEWYGRRNTLLEEAKTLKTLFLFDQDLHRAGKRVDEGIRIIKGVLKDTDATILCGLLSHTFSQLEAYDLWYEWAKNMRINRNRFIPLSKRLLHGDFSIFARMVKLTLLNTPCAQLREMVGKKIRAAQVDAHTKVKTISIYDFEHIVFRASAHEGVWEPDTLFRIFGLFHRSATLKLAREDDTLHKLARKIREVSAINTESPEAPKRTSWKIQRLDIYDEAAYINGLHMAIELGDIFVKEGGAKQYILLAQPCDLMVRSSGIRKTTITEALLARIVNRLPVNKSGIPTDPENYYELQYFDEDDGSSRYVSFRETQAVKLDVLDMCAYNADGVARLKVDNECPPNLIPAWEKHHSVLCRHAAEIIEKYRGLADRGIATDVLKLTIPQSSNEKLFAAEINLPQNTIKYKCKRLGRLRQPQATAMLSRFANYMARAALEMDFGRELPDEEDAED
jgi:hypothetical protein